MARKNQKHRKEIRREKALLRQNAGQVKDYNKLHETSSQILKGDNLGVLERMKSAGEIAVSRLEAKLTSTKE